MAWNETISAPKKLSPWEKVKKVASGAYNAATDVGERVAPMLVKSTAERSLKKDAQRRLPMTPAFSRFVEGMPTNMNAESNTKKWKKMEPTKDLPGGWQEDPRPTAVERVGVGLAKGAERVAGALENPEVSRLASSLVNKFKDKLDQRALATKPGTMSIVYQDPWVVPHEALHGWFGNKTMKGDIDAEKKKMTIMPFSEQINKDWEKLKKDKRIGPILDRIDKNIQGSNLYKGIDDYSLANERYAYLGANAGVGTYMADYPELKKIFGDVMNARLTRSGEDPFAVNNVLAAGNNQMAQELPTKPVRRAINNKIIKKK